jgi:hypothetical protein
VFAPEGIVCVDNEFGLRLWMFASDGLDRGDGPPPEASAICGEGAVDDRRAEMSLERLL